MGSQNFSRRAGGQTAEPTCSRPTPSEGEQVGDGGNTTHDDTDAQQLDGGGFGHHAGHDQGDVEGGDGHEAEHDQVSYGGGLSATHENTSKKA
ncbi:MAG: hypothetical protein J6386_08375 [Candidatus Synoicihabitans palmerolidicus]|nr:hypothetical protein [Candidatus Synoicihabitans palmerolidicus]